MHDMEERAACALLKARFEAAGFAIVEHQPFAEAGVELELDGYDPARRVGYEYITEEAGDGWDVDAEVIAKLAAARRAGDVFVLVVDEREAPDAATLGPLADAFLAEVAEVGKPARDEPAPAKPAKKPVARKPAAKKPAAKKPAAKKPAAKKPAAKKPAAKKPAKKR